MCGLTFELTPTVEAGSVSRVGDDSTAGAGPAYAACRSGSGVERGVRQHPAELPRAKRVEVAADWTMKLEPPAAVPKDALKVRSAAT